MCTAHGHATIVVLFSAVLHRARCHQQAPSVTVALPAWAVNAPHKGQSEFCHLRQNSPAAAYSTAFKVQLEKDFLNIKEEKKNIYYRAYFSPLSASYYITIASCSSVHSFPYTACHFVISHI